MKNKILSIAVFLLLTLLTSAWAGDLLVLGNWILPGNWISKEIGRQGTVETVFSFKVNGTDLTGTVADAEGKTAIREGRISGDEISFVVMRSVGGNERKLAYKGQVSLNEIRFTLEVQGQKGQPLEFIAKRESPLPFQRVFPGGREFQRDGDVPLQIPSEGKTHIPDK
jgi:hypothetical protein